jgi:hypothetical protein
MFSKKVVLYLVLFALTFSSCTFSLRKTIRNARETGDSSFVVKKDGQRVKYTDRALKKMMDFANGGVSNYWQFIFKDSAMNKDIVAVQTSRAYYVNSKRGYVPRFVKGAINGYVESARTEYDYYLSIPSSSRGAGGGSAGSYQKRSATVVTIWLENTLVGGGWEEESNALVAKWTKGCDSSSLMLAKRIKNLKKVKTWNNIAGYTALGSFITAVGRGANFNTTTYVAGGVLGVSLIAYLATWAWRDEISGQMNYLTKAIQVYNNEVKRKGTVLITH